MKIMALLNPKKRNFFLIFSNQLKIFRMIKLNFLLTRKWFLEKKTQIGRLNDDKHRLFFINANFGRNETILHDFG
jgi:hypothetical protein